MTETRGGATALAEPIRILNCVNSAHQLDDWSAVEHGLIDADKTPRREVDLREAWWHVQDQGSSGACVGYAAAGVLTWYFTKIGFMHEKQTVSARFIWMANKETDTITRYPTTFIEEAGTQTKRAFHIAKKWGSVPEEVLPMTVPVAASRSRSTPVDAAFPLYQGGEADFYKLAGEMKIGGYYNLGLNQKLWKLWLAEQGPILVRIAVDKGFKDSSRETSVLSRFSLFPAPKGHAAALVGYDREHFILRNSYGIGWKDEGHAYLTPKYAHAAISEAYGAVLIA